MDNISIPLKRIDDTSLVPRCAHEGDAAVDLHATIDLELKPFERALVPCGIAVAIPEGYAGLVIPRSGLAIKQGISLVNSPGLIDSTYRGEINAILINLDPNETFFLKRGDRIAQLSIVKVENPRFELCEDLSSTVRGENGFGSTGVAAIQ